MDAADGFEALMAQEYAGLVRVAVAITGDDGLAHEVTQEAFTRALVRWRRVSGYERPGAWLRLVTVRLAVRAAGQRRRDGLGVAIPERPSIDALTDLTLRAAIDALSAADRAVIVLHYLCDLPIEEIAHITRSRPGTVKVRLHRTRRRLAETLTMEVGDAVHR